MNATTPIREDVNKDPEVLKREIDATRADVGETLDRLQAKLSPGQLLDQTLGLVQRHGGEMAANLGNTIKQNPVPMLLTGIGIAWLIASGSSQRARAPLTEPATDEWDRSDSTSTTGEVGERVKETAAAARERMSAAASRISGAAESASQAMHRAGYVARDQAVRAREGFSRMIDEQPLLVGVLGLALGAVIGAALPPTQQEDELLGPTRDRTLQRAKSAAAEQLDEVRSATQQAH